VLGAENEYLACRHLKRCGIKVPRVVAYAAAGRLASRRSVVVCDELAGYISLEDVLRRWHTSPPRPSASRRLLLAVAVFVRRLHEAGVAHRDLYVCHLLLHEKSWEDGRAELAVLDLHRARIFASLPHYWRRRDLAAWLFSALDAPLHPRAWLGFVRIYSGRPLAEVFASDGRFWRSVYRRALKLYAKGLQRGIVAGNSCTDGKVANEVGTAAPSWKSLTRPRIQT